MHFNAVGLMGGGSSGGSGGPTVAVDIGSTVSNFDLFVAAGSPTVPVSVKLTIGGDGAAEEHPFVNKLLIAGFAAGTTIDIFNHGFITGQGGKGGRGAHHQSTPIGFLFGVPVLWQCTLPDPAQDGFDGGDAVVVSGLAKTISYYSRYAHSMLGGGGGGGGGGLGSCTDGGNDTRVQGGGAGGGAGWGSIGGIGGGVGTNANIETTPAEDGLAGGTVAGTGGLGSAGNGGAKGGDGGDYGEAGGDSDGASGGTPGNAVQITGPSTFTFPEGFDPALVKGAIG